MSVPNPRNYEIKVRLVDGTHAVPEIPPDMGLGDSVRFSSPDGTSLNIDFPEDSPFLDDSGQSITHIADSQPRELRKQGSFTCQCKLRLPSGQMVGWPSSGQSGGVVPIKK
jgi:hypothetical protein